MATDLQNLVAELESNIAQVVLGKADVVRLCVVALLAGDHVLLEDVPGVGKTLIGKALAKSISVGVLPHPIHGRSVAQRHHRRQRVQSANRAVRLHAGTDFSATSCWPTRSIARRPEPKAPCSRP